MMNCRSIEVFIGFIVFGQSETHLVSCMWFAQGVSVKDLRVSFVEGGFQQRQRRTWRTEWPIQICKNLEQKWRYWGALWCFRIFGSVRASYSAWPEGISFLSNTIKGIANTFLKLFNQNFTWNDCARMVFFKSTVADRSIVFLHRHCGHGVQLMSKDHRTFKTMIYNNRYGTMFLQGFVPLPGFVCRLSRLPERKAGPACSSVTKKAEADWERKTCAQCSRCFFNCHIWHIMTSSFCFIENSEQVSERLHRLQGASGTPNDSIPACILGHSLHSRLIYWSIDDGNRLAFVAGLEVLQYVDTGLYAAHQYSFAVAAVSTQGAEEKNWTRIRAVIANWCKVDRKLNFKPRWPKVLRDSSSSEALFFIVWFVLTNDGRLRLHWPLAWEGPIQPRKHDQRWNIEIIER